MPDLSRLWPVAVVREGVQVSHYPTFASPVGYAIVFEDVSDIFRREDAEYTYPLRFASRAEAQEQVRRWFYRMPRECWPRWIAFSRHIGVKVTKGARRARTERFFSVEE